MFHLLLLVPAAAVVWKLYQLARHPKDAPLRSVTLCLVTAVASYPFALPNAASEASMSADHGAGKIVQNVLLLGTVYFLMCFYLYSADEQAGGRRARTEAAVVVMVAALLIADAATVPHDVFAGSYSTADMTIPQVAFFYGLAGAYLMYALAVAGRWTRRCARQSSRPHSTGLWMAAVGLSAMAAACLVRGVMILIRWLGGIVPQQVTAAVAFFLAVAIVLFVVGIIYPAVRTRITSARLWFRHRRDHRRLAPLWQLLAEAYPDNVLMPCSDDPREARRVRGVHRRYYRRMVECRDGLVDVSPYLAGGEDEDGLLDLTPEELADRLRRAVHRVEQGAPAPRRAMPLAISGGRDQESDVRQLIAISEALSSSSHQPTDRGEPVDADHR
ncbi:MAB_1171c family putative transporter [Streptomyces violens]|uniref:MAB_1171c family putative transporter n=1 Tax=Streptomyces violens TaxID=66377 RepID=UPI001FE21ABF|nr:MAB_1171c family putative transporter [Streptomyces violens]